MMACWKRRLNSSAFRSASLLVSSAVCISRSSLALMWRVLDGTIGDEFLSTLESLELTAAYESREWKASGGAYGKADSVSPFACFEHRPR